MLSALISRSASSVCSQFHLKELRTRHPREQSGLVIPHRGFHVVERRTAVPQPDMTWKLYVDASDGKGNIGIDSRSFGVVK
jgi:hypothetical protein